MKRRFSRIDFVASACVFGALLAGGCRAHDATVEPEAGTPVTGAGACSFTVTQNKYDRRQQLGTISFKNNGAVSSNFVVTFVVPSGVHCNSASAGWTYAQSGNACQYRKPGATLATGASLAFNYSTDSRNFTGATGVTVSDSTCGCTPESDASFCSRLGKNCGSVTAADNCGQSRMVASCGGCVSPATCGGGGIANVCGGTQSGTDASADASPDANVDANIDASVDTSPDMNADTSPEASVDTSADVGPTVACSRSAPAACRRGMYLSLYTAGIGQVSFTGALDPYRNILGDAAKEKRVLDYVAAHGINALSLYDLGSITQSATLKLALVSFMGRARTAGVQRIEAVGDESTALWDQIAAFHQTQAKFDGVITEIEFWNGGTVSTATKALAYIRAKGLTRVDGTALSYGSYIGWATASDIAALVPYVDRLYVHAYVDQPSQAYDYVATRVQSIAQANTAQSKDVEVVAIFSAEDHQWAAGPETFMGEWLAANSIAAAETTFLSSWSTQAPAQVRLTGFQYYEFFFLSEYVP